MPILDVELLRAFVAFADTLNFTRAARLVHLSQPALFERVRRLSERLEVKLYERTGRNVRLTEAGLSLAAFARDTLSRTDAFVRELRGEARYETVTLAAGEGSWLYCLRLPRLALGSQLNPAESGVADRRYRLSRE